MKSGKLFNFFIYKYLYCKDRVAEKGVFFPFFWVSKMIFIEFFWVISLPISLPLHFLGFRAVPVNVTRIGHLASEIDAFLKDIQLGNIENKKWFILAPNEKVVNPTLLEYWRKHIRVISGKWKCIFFSLMTRHGLITQDTKHYVWAMGKSATYYSIQKDWGQRPPILKLEMDHRNKGWRILQDWGIPKDGWFISIHARENGYSPEDESIHAHRNSKIERLIPVICEIRRRGGWVIRMGDPTMQKLPPMEGVIDYAHSSYRSDWMDIFLCAENKFFLGNSSGLSILATVFGVPCALANMVPTSHLGFSAFDLSIPKLIWSKKKNRYLSFHEIFTSEISNFRLAKLFEYADLVPEENSSEDILDFTTEMLDKLEGKFVPLPEDESLQAQYKSYLKPHHYGFGTASRVGSLFLRKYQDLFLPP